MPIEEIIKSAKTRIEFIRKKVNDGEYEKEASYSACRALQTAISCLETADELEKRAVERASKQLGDRREF